jgi:hypothetical protein
MFIIPYILDHPDPQPDIENRSARTVPLTRSVLRKTAARSVARFAICWVNVTLSSALCIAIQFVFLRRYVLWIGAIGRWAMVMGQVSSVFTYSCAYKCVSTWASPLRFGKGDEDKFNPLEREELRREVYQFIGHAYHVRVLFWIVELAWRLLGLLHCFRRHFGRTIFASFRSPHDDEFSDEKIWTVRLLVEKPIGISSSWEVIDTIDFKVPDAFVKYRDHRLRGDTLHVRGLACLLVIPVLFDILAPSELLRHGQLPTGVKIVLLIMQIATWMVQYKDMPNKSVNCKFEVTECQSSSGSNDRGNPDRRHLTATPVRGSGRPHQNSSGIKLSRLGMDPGPGDLGERASPIGPPQADPPHLVVSNSKPDGGADWEWEGEGQGEAEEVGEAEAKAKAEGEDKGDDEGEEEGEEEGEGEGGDKGEVEGEEEGIEEGEGENPEGWEGASDEGKERSTVMARSPGPEDGIRDRPTKEDGPALVAAHLISPGA